MKNALRYLIAAGAGLVIAFVIMLAQGIFSQTDEQDVMRILSDAFFASGVLLAGAGLILVASNGGLFDMFGYAAVLFFNLFRRDVTKRKYKDFYEYREAKKEKKRSTAYLLLVGVGLIAVAAVFLIFYYNV